MFKFLLLTLLITFSQAAKLLVDRKLQITPTKASKLQNPSRKLASLSQLLTSSEIDKLAKKSRLNEFEAHSMAVTTSAKQQKLSQLLNMVTGFKQTMEDVTSSVNAQLSRINAMLSSNKRV